MKKLSTLLLVIVLNTAVINAQTILNSGFENWTGNCPVNIAPDDWTNFSTSLGPDEAGACAGAVSSYEGSSHMNLVWSSPSDLLEGASQQVTGLNIGETYIVTFYAVNNRGLYAFDEPANLDFYINSSVVFSTPELISGDPWAQYTVTFVATSTTDTIGFQVMNGSTGTAGSAGVDAVSVTSTVGVNELNAADQFSIYPNPATGTLYLKWPVISSASIKIEILDLSGSLVSEGSVNDDTIDILKLRSGIYFLRIQTDEGVQQLKFVKE